MAWGDPCYPLQMYRSESSVLTGRQGTVPLGQGRVYAQRPNWKAYLVIVERARSGISLHQNIYNPSTRPWIQNIRPEGSKQDRASPQSPKFESGEIWLPRSAPWLKAFEDEYIQFPHGKFDDQIDSMVQFLAAVDTGGSLICRAGPRI